MKSTLERSTAPNFGLYKIANISDRTFNDLRTAQANYLRVDTLRAADDVISNKTASLIVLIILLFTQWYCDNITLPSI